MGRKNAGHRDPCIRRLQKTFLLFKNGEQPALFFIRLAGVSEQLIARGVERGFELSLGKLRLAHDDGLALRVRRGDLFDLELVADGVADMAFTHGTGHAVNFKCDLIHKIASCAFAAALRLDKANHLSKKQTRRDFFCRYHTARVGRSQEEKQYGKNEEKRAEKGLDNRG